MKKLRNYAFYSYFIKNKKRKKRKKRNKKNNNIQAKKRNCVIFVCYSMFFHVSDRGQTMLYTNYAFFAKA